MRFLFCALLLPGLGLAAILPDTIGAYHKGAVSPPPLTDRGVWDEYGLKASETAVYEDGKAKFTATVYRLGDPTACMAAFEWQRPAEGKPSSGAKLSAETADSLMLVHGNYLLNFAGYKPTQPELDAVIGSLINVDSTTLPVLPGYLPLDGGLVPNSERYILGPASLQKFSPAIPPSVAAFHLGTEAQLAVFHSQKGDMTMLIFSYQTHQMAMQRIPEFQKLPGVTAKRTGPLVALVLSPPDPDYAERLLAQVRFQAQVTRDEYVPTQRDNIGNLVTNAFVLIGILLVFGTGSGLVYGGVRAYMRRGLRGQEADALTTLHLR